MGRMTAYSVLSIYDFWDAFSVCVADCLRYAAK